MLLYFFMAPHIITSIFYSTIRDQVCNHEKSVLEFITLLSVMLAPVKSLTNAVLFLITNVKSEQFLRNLGR